MESPFKAEILKGKVVLLTGGALGTRYQFSWANMKPPLLSWVVVKTSSTLVLNPLTLLEFLKKEFLYLNFNWGLAESIRGLRYKLGLIVRHCMMIVWFHWLVLCFMDTMLLCLHMASIIGNAAKLLSTLNKEAADQQDLQNLITVSDGQFPEVAKARKEVQLANEELNSLIGLYRKQLRMSKLEFMSVSGTTHLIELAVDVKVPSNWVKINSTKKTVCSHPPDVLTALDHLALAKEELTISCRAAWDSFLSGFSKYYAEFQAAIQALASLDCLHSLAVLSRNKNYVPHVFVNDDEPPVQIHICSGRHTVLETTLHDNFIPNDTDLHADREYCQIITGPNMGGKSCYIRQVALIAIMAQVILGALQSMRIIQDLLYPSTTKKEPIQ